MLVYCWGGDLSCVEVMGFLSLVECTQYPNKGPCAQLIYTLAPKYLHSDYFKTKP